MAVYKLNRPIERSELEADTYYFDESAELFFYTPDAVGGVWYDTKQEMFEEHNGPDTIYYVDEIHD